jgi:hypothetical protein
VWGFGDAGDSLDGLLTCSGSGSGATTNGELMLGNVSVMDCQTHYWALRQQARAPLGGGGCPVAGGRRVVAPLWWWGVVFDLWIVVASI